MFGYVLRRTPRQIELFELGLPAVASRRGQVAHPIVVQRDGIGQIEYAMLRQRGHLVRAVGGEPPEHLACSGRVKCACSQHLQRVGLVEPTVVVAAADVDLCQAATNFHLVARSVEPVCVDVHEAALPGRTCLDHWDRVRGMADERDAQLAALVGDRVVGVRGEPDVDLDEVGPVGHRLTRRRPGLPGVHDLDVRRTPTREQRLIAVHYAAGDDEAGAEECSGFDPVTPLVQQHLTIHVTDGGDTVGEKQRQVDHLLPTAVHMGVDETGQDELATPVDNFRVRGHVYLTRGADNGNPVATHQHRGVGQRPPPGRVDHRGSRNRNGRGRVRVIVRSAAWTAGALMAPATRPALIPIPTPRTRRLVGLAAITCLHREFG